MPKANPASVSGESDRGTNENSLSRASGSDKSDVKYRLRCYRVMCMGLSQAPWRRLRRKPELKSGVKVRYF